MELSARNQLQGGVTEVRLGNVMAEISLDPATGKLSFPLSRALRRSA
jgi:molybdopterin-binding protein